MSMAKWLGKTAAKAVLAGGKLTRETCELTRDSFVASKGAAKNFFEELKNSYREEKK